MLAHEKFDDKRLVRFAVRPFDLRYCYYTPIRPVWNEPRPELWMNFAAGSKFLISRFNSGGKHRDPPAYFSSALIDGQIISVNASAIPISVHELLLGQVTAVMPNLSDQGMSWLASVYVHCETSREMWEGVWYHALAMLYAPAYIVEHSETFVSDWPRIPLPKTRNALTMSSSLGRTLSQLLDSPAPVVGVSTNPLPHQAVLGILSAPDLRVTAGWGRQDSQGRVNPGKGLVKARTYTAAEADAIRKGANQLGIEEVHAFELLGPPLDVFLNATTCWRCVPTAVWEYFIGGYQVIKKWLSYREESILGRPLTKEEARELTGIVRRLAAIVLMTDELNANYSAVRDNAFSWSPED
jgi:hypothetical protein